MSQLTYLILTAFLPSFSFTNTVTTIDFANQQHLLNIARANDAFTYRLLHQLELMERFQHENNNDEPKNLLVSPFSLSTVLTMALVGAKGNTAEEMTRALGFDEKLSKTQLINSYRTLLQNFSSSTNFSTIVQLSNAVALTSQFSLLPTYHNIIQNKFNATVFTSNNDTDFKNKKEEINKWINEKTVGKMADLFGEKCLKYDNEMILLNSMYFKGAWKNRFIHGLEKKFTYSSRKSSTKSSIYMMRMNAEIKYAALNEGELVELPYKGESQSMLLFLPNENFDYSSSSISLAFSQALKQQSFFTRIFTYFNLFSENKYSFDFDRLRFKEFRLYLPAFQIKSNLQLKPILQLMGIKTAFEDIADFSQMTGQQKLRISQVLQKSYIKVNAEGSEAAATSAVMITPFSAIPRSNFDVVFNRPFLFLIRDNRFQLTLFAGIVNKPEKDF